MSLLTPLLFPTWQLLRTKSGDNDGLVPVSSQAWGETCGTIEADHWAQIGWAGGEVWSCGPVCPRLGQQVGQRLGGARCEKFSTRRMLLAMHGEIGKQTRAAQRARILDDRAPALEQRRLHDRQRAPHQGDLPRARD